MERLDSLSMTVLLGWVAHVGAAAAGSFDEIIHRCEVRICGRLKTLFTTTGYPMVMFVLDDVRKPKNQEKSSQTPRVI